MNHQPLDCLPPLNLSLSLYDHKLPEVSIFFWMHVIYLTIKNYSEQLCHQ